MSVIKAVSHKRELPLVSTVFDRKQAISQKIWLGETGRSSNFMILFFLNSMILGCLFYREYNERTLKSLLVTGLGRSKIILSRLLVWGLLHCTMYLVAFSIVYGGY